MSTLNLDLTTHEIERRGETVILSHLVQDDKKTLNQYVQNPLLGKSGFQIASISDIFLIAKYGDEELIKKIRAANGFYDHTSGSTLLNDVLEYSAGINGMTARIVSVPSSDENVSAEEWNIRKVNFPDYNKKVYQKGESRVSQDGNKIFFSLKDLLKESEGFNFINQLVGEKYSIQDLKNIPEKLAGYREDKATDSTFFVVPSKSSIRVFSNRVISLSYNLGDEEGFFINLSNQRTRTDKANLIKYEKPKQKIDYNPK